MSTPESYHRFCQTHNEISRNYSMQAEEEQISFHGGLQDLNARAGNELRRAYENYLQELQAASGGDDSIPRGTVAYRNLRREYSMIQAEYVKELETRQRGMLETTNALCSSASVKVLDNWIECLREIRQSLAVNEPQPSESKSNEPKQKEPKSAKQPTS